MKVKYIISLCLLIFCSKAFATSLQQMYDDAVAGNGYDKLIVLDCKVTYTGGFNQDVQSVCIHGNGAFIDLNGEGISINGENKVFNIDHCIIISPSSLSKFIYYENGASGNILNNTFYGTNDNGNSFYGIKFIECINDTSTIKNNIFHGFNAAIYYYTVDCESYYENKHLSISNNLVYNCSTRYLGWGGWTGDANSFIPSPGDGELISDPLFKSITNLDFSLKENSPCIDQGTDVGLIYNGNDPDIGALESTYTIFRSTKISGIVSGQLKKELSPYLLTDSIIIPQSKSLTVEPGVIIKVNSGKSINVFGQLILSGNDDDSIYFENNSVYSNYWNGISFFKESSHSSIISKCIIKNAHQSIKCYNENLQIKNNYFYDNGILCGDSSKVIITNNIFYNTTTFTGKNAINCTDYSTVEISDNTFYCSYIRSELANINVKNNYFMGQEKHMAQQYWLMYLYNSNVCINNNYFQNNYGAILASETKALCINNILTNCAHAYGITNQSTARIINNTLYPVQYGIYCTNESTAKVINTIIWNSDSTYHYAIKQFDTGTITSEYCDLFTFYVGEGNIFSNPEFTKSDIGKFYLKSSSLCIDNGTADTSGLSLPEYDMLNNYRIGNNRIDIGALEYHGDLSSYSEILTSNTIKIYPNPSPGLFNIGIIHMTNENYKIKVLDIKGKIVYRDKTKSEYNQIDLSNYTKGVYFITVETDQSIKAEKIVIY